MSLIKTEGDFSITLSSKERPLGFRWVTDWIIGGIISTEL